MLNEKNRQMSTTKWGEGRDSLDLLYWRGQVSHKPDLELSIIGIHWLKALRAHQLMLSLEREGNRCQIAIFQTVNIFTVLWS